MPQCLEYAEMLSENKEIWLTSKVFTLSRGALVNMKCGKSNVDQLQIFAVVYNYNSCEDWCL